MKLTKASETIAKFGDKIPTTREAATTISKIHKDVGDRTELTYNGFKKMILRATDSGVMKMVEKPGLGACFYRHVEPEVNSVN